MTMRNIAYVSKTKVDNYYPQLPASYRSEDTGKLSVKLGVANAEATSKHAPDMSDIGRALSIVKHLRYSGEIGTVADPKTWFEGVVELGSIVEYGQIVFGTVFDESGVATALCLTASTKHMLGDEYKAVENDEYTSRREIGLTRSRVFRSNSGSLGFADSLDAVNRVRRESSERGNSLTDFGAGNVKRAALSSQEWAAYNRWPALNPLIKRLYPASSRWSFRWSDLLRAFVSGLFFRPWVSLLMGSTAFRAKRDAVRKVGTYSSGLTEYERDLLTSLKVVAASCGRERWGQAYEFVAMNLLQGEVGGIRVLLGSPLYLALAPSTPRQWS